MHDLIIIYSALSDHDTACAADREIPESEALQISPNSAMQGNFRMHSE